MRAGVIIYNPFLDKILLIHRWKDGQEYFVIPGGTIEPGEKPLEAALREMKEEVDLTFSADQLCTAFSLNNQGKEEYYFYTELSTADTPLMQGEEAQRSSLQNIYQPKWVSLQELYNYNLRPEILKSLLLEFLTQESLKN
ncbi:NUDIX domain-containing protein [Streptococcus sp. Marseille-P6264]|uniref:NUDIX hydrolase n=1 Tax=Streptococcus sp. Marseille-P6264 TaxID=2487315 RepID=UPI0011E7AD0B|nr:NUDIX domain-containing protein [Streptococcus sp. Marseille-P6264]